MTKPGPSIARNTTFDSAAQLTGLVFSMLTGVLLARVVGDAGRGEYVWATAMIGMMVMSFTNFGIELAASVLVAKDNKLFAQVHTLIVIVAVLLGLVTAVALMTAFEPIRRHLLLGIERRDLLALAIGLPFWNYLYGCYGALVGMSAIRMRAVFDLGLNLAQNLVVAGILLARLKSPPGETVRLMVVAFYALVMVGSVVLCGLMARRWRLWEWPRRGLWRRVFEYGFWVYVGNVGIDLSSRLDGILVKSISGSMAAFGVYNLATSLTWRTRILPQALVRSAYARVCSLPSPDSARLVAACFRQVLALGLILLVGGAALSPLIPVIYSSDFRPAVVPFIIFLGGRLFSNCSWMLSMYFSGHLAKPRIATFVNWSILPVQAVLAWVAMKQGGLIGVAAVTSATYLLVLMAFLTLFLRAQKTVGLKDLFLFGQQDIVPWKNLVGRMIGRGGSR